MSLRLTGRQMNKLGDRLASPEPITDEDYALLGQVAEDYQAVLDKVEEKLQGLGYQATTRVKTTSTLVEKLRREPHLRLKSIRDVAGARIVIHGGRWEQDQVVDRIVQAFESCPKAPERIDRRKTPSHGYRAYHVVVYEDGVPVEIQVRTKLQDAWAQITEKLGDAWGRGLRYGLGPEQPDLQLVLAGEDEPLTRAQVVRSVGRLSDGIDLIESAQHQIDRLGAQLDGHKNEAQALTDRLLAAVINLGSQQ
jgi:ppGpp synthetase/RelA/SpoT-type nucleotidyltranferase